MLLQLNEPSSGKTNAILEKSLLCAIGIDLGTTHSVIAVAHSHDKVEVLLIDDDALVPSCVAYEDDCVYTGAEAFSKLTVFSSFKRFMDAPAICLRGEKTPIELSAALLQKIRISAEKHLGTFISKAVITVPAYFDDTARQATKDAAALAGIEVLRLLSEPTAAALAYGLDEKNEGVFAIYDLGGGTFDISILKMTKGVFQVLATGGDTHLGGDDIDDAICAFWQKTDELSRRKARTAKEALSQTDVWQIDDVHLNREQLTILAKPFIERTIDIAGRVLADAQMSVPMIDGVVMVGGATRMPLVQAMVESYFGKVPLTNLDPDQVVARGAALQAFMLTEGQGTLLLDVTPLSLGVETMGGLVERIIPRNTAIPTRIRQEFTTYENNQTAIEFHVVQGERELSQDCRSLARFTLSGIPTMPAGVARVAVTYQLDADGLLSIEAVEQQTGQKQTSVVRPRYGLSEEQLRSMIYESHAHGQDDMEKRLLIETKVDARRFLRYCQTAYEEDGHLLNETDFCLIQRLSAELETALDYNDRVELKRLIEHLKDATSTFAVARINEALRKKLVGNVV